MFVLMGGLRGCYMPDCCEHGYETIESAVDSADSLYELTKKQRKALLRDQWVELKPSQGAQYCEITECDDPDCEECGNNPEETEETE